MLSVSLPTFIFLGVIALHFHFVLLGLAGFCCISNKLGLAVSNQKARIKSVGKISRQYKDLG
jgi:hypothetical protein